MFSGINTPIFEEDTLDSMMFSGINTPVFEEDMLDSMMFNGINTPIFEEDQKLEAIETIVLGKSWSEIVMFCIVNSVSGQTKAHPCRKEAWIFIYLCINSLYTLHIQWTSRENKCKIPWTTWEAEKHRSRRHICSLQLRE